MSNFIRRKSPQEIETMVDSLVITLRDRYQREDAEGFLEELIAKTLLEAAEEEVTSRVAHLSPEELVDAVNLFKEREAKRRSPFPFDPPLTEASPEQAVSKPKKKKKKHGPKS